MPAKVLGDFGDNVDLEVKQGSTFSRDGAFANPDGTPVDLTGCELRAQLRRTVDSPAVNFGVEVTDAAAGEFTFGLSKEQTIGLTQSKYLWDFEYEDTLGRVTPICYGEVRVQAEVTHG